MRLDKMFLKMFQIEPRVPVRMLLDTSASMAAGSGEKFLYARRLAAALCYVGLVRLDTIQILPFSNAAAGRQDVRRRTAPLSARCRVSRSARSRTASTDFLTVVREFLNEYPQRGLVIVISDFLDEAAARKPCSIWPITATN